MPKQGSGDLTPPANPPVPFRVEHQHAFAGGVVEVRRYFWSSPLQQTIRAEEDALVVNLAVTSRPAKTRVDRLASPADPLSDEAGRLLIMIPGMLYRLSAPEGTLRSLHLSLECARLEALAGERIAWSELAQFGGELRAVPGIESHLVRMHRELLMPGIGQEEVIQAFADLICVELVRRFRSGVPARPDVHSGGLSAWRMRRIVERVHSDGPAPRLVELAELCGLTERQLGRAFKAETGTTIGRFVDEVTMERAHRLLATTGMTLAEIAGELGFASADSFAQSFRRLTGASPGALRRLR